MHRQPEVELVNNAYSKPDTIDLPAVAIIARNYELTGVFRARLMPLDSFSLTRPAASE